MTNILKGDNSRQPANFGNLVLTRSFRIICRAFLMILFGGSVAM